MKANGLGFQGAEVETWFTKAGKVLAGDARAEEMASMGRKIAAKLAMWIADFDPDADYKAEANLTALWAESWGRICAEHRWIPSRQCRRKGARPNRGITFVARELKVDPDTILSALRGHTPSNKLVAAVTGLGVAQVRRLRARGMRVTIG
jgi:hypothetical protein